MSEYVIVTDSSCDMTADMVSEVGIQVLPLSFTIKGQDLKNYPDNRDMDPKQFYDLQREGEMATTAAVNLSQYEEFLTPILESGKDVLLLAFSSGLSATYQTSRLAVEELQEKFPDRKIFTVDTLSASLGQGLLIWHAAQKKKEGMAIEELRDWVETHKLNMCHWFTVDDLQFLKRGGRISAATALVGTMLKIKPVLHMDDEGHLINMSKARGRKASLDAILNKVGELGVDLDKQTMFISHSDCMDDVQYVADQLKRRFNVPEVRWNYIGPVIGAHTGPGCLAVFFMGTHR